MPGHADRESCDKKEMGIYQKQEESPQIHVRAVTCQRGSGPGAHASILMDGNGRES